MRALIRAAFVLTFCVSVLSVQAQGDPATGTSIVPGTSPDDPRPAPWAISKDKILVTYSTAPANPSTPPPPGLYVAMGDSITFGTGIKDNCQPFPTHPVDVDAYCPTGNSYAVLVARGLRAAGIAGHFVDVGIPGAHVQRVIDEELPYVPSSATLITIYIGTNDSRPGADPKHDATYIVRLYERQYEDLLKAVHSKAPHARIVLINFPNQQFLNGPGSSYKIPDSVLPMYDQISETLAAFVDSHSPTYPVVDTICNPASYDWSLMYKLTVHPNEQGAAILADSVLKVIRADKPVPPPSSCKWYSFDRAKQFANQLGLNVR